MWTSILPEGYSVTCGSPLTTSKARASVKAYAAYYSEVIVDMDPERQGVLE